MCRRGVFPNVGVEVAKVDLFVEPTANPVVAGGVTLLYASRILAGLMAENNDQTVASQIVRRAIQAPARKIAENAGVEGSIVIGKLTVDPPTSAGTARRAGCNCSCRYGGQSDRHRRTHAMAVL